MNAKYYILLMYCVSKLVLAEIEPEIQMPTSFKVDNFISKEINGNSPVLYNTVESSGCSEIKYKYFTFYSNNKIRKEYNVPIDTFPIDSWFCLTSNSVFTIGYDRSMNEKIVYSEKESLWIKVNNKKPDIIPSDQDGKFIPLRLYNVKAKNAKGYVVFDENLTKYDKRKYKNPKILVGFCLVNESIYSSLCGYGNLELGSAQIPYFLKSIESIEIGVNNKANAKLLDSINN